MCNLVSGKVVIFSWIACYGANNSGIIDGTPGISLTAYFKPATSFEKIAKLALSIFFVFFVKQLVDFKTNTKVMLLQMLLTVIAYNIDRFLQHELGSARFIIDRRYWSS